MLGTLLKKKLSDNQLANIFLNGILEMVENSFDDVAGMINDDLAFVSSPKLDEKDNGRFAVILIAANCSLLEATFESSQVVRIEKLIFEKLSKLLNNSAHESEELVRDYQKYMNRINHPSKNPIYAVSKAIFFKYELAQFQDEYFKRLQAPNPIFLKRMDLVIPNYIWDWDAFFKKFRIEE